MREIDDAEAMEMAGWPAGRCGGGVVDWISGFGRDVADSDARSGDVWPDCEWD